MSRTSVKLQVPANLKRPQTAIEDKWQELLFRLLLIDLFRYTVTRGRTAGTLEPGGAAARI